MTREKGEGKANAGPQLRVARLYLAKAPNFSQQDVKKALADAKSPPYQPRNPKSIHHRTDEEGLVTFDDQDTIEQHEEWCRRKALKLREELFPDTDGDSFFVKGSEIRKVYSMKPDSSFQTVISKAQKRKMRKQEKDRAARNGTLGEESSAQARPSKPPVILPRPRRDDCRPQDSQ